MLRRSISLATLCSLAIWGVAGAQSTPQALTLQLTRVATGWIGAHIAGPAGAGVTLVERGPVADEPIRSVVLPASGVLDIAKVLPWRCDRRLRQVAATATASPGGVQMSAGATAGTPGCSDRLALTLHPASPRAKRVETFRVTDRWGLGGVDSRLCTSEPAGVNRRCHSVALAGGEPRTAVVVHPARSGRWSVTLTEPDGSTTLRRALQIQRASPRLRVLATGDSMITTLDGFLKRGLARRAPTSLTSDAHYASGISKSFMFDWLSHARTSARRTRPDVTVMFLGANDGFPLTTPRGVKAECCGEAWVQEYGRRAGIMMRTYARDGAGSVYWMLLPAPRGVEFQRIFRTVNLALVEAAKAYPGVVHLVDLPATFTPDGRFHNTIRWHGTTVSVRQADGRHLSNGGAAIAATLIMRQMSHDGLIPRR